MQSLLLLANIDSTIWVGVAAFLGIAVLAWLGMDWFTAEDQFKTERRLDEIRNPNLRKQKEDLKGLSASATVTKVLETATPAFAKPLQPKSEQEAGKLKERLDHAGFRAESAPSIFLGTKFVFLIVGLVLGGGVAVAFEGFTQGAMMKLVLIAGAMFYLPDLVVKFLTSRRKESIFLGLPDALDLMVVCVEAGLGLDQAMRRVATEMEHSNKVIAKEFGLSNLQLQMGSTRAEVLSELGRRNGVDDLRALSAIIIQADKFGSSIAQALRVQSDSMRTRRKQIAEEKAAKTAVQLIFPLVLFIFPGIFVVLVGPAGITMVREMFPAMSGG
ncbi:MAG: type II secretion system F family protein [Pirellulaceae bacterium]|nr:type II secretion system F family protein [Pirellulaceae bacterium]